MAEEMHSSDYEKAKADATSKVAEITAQKNQLGMSVEDAQRQQQNLRDISTKLSEQEQKAGEVHNELTTLDVKRKLYQELFTKRQRTITEEEVYPELKTIKGAENKFRKAVRAVVFDDENKVALINVLNRSYYKLPGGGIEESESMEDALKRECLEEIGSSAIYRRSYQKLAGKESFNMVLIKITVCK